MPAYYESSRAFTSVLWSLAVGPGLIGKSHEGRLSGGIGGKPLQIVACGRLDLTLLVVHGRSSYQVAFSLLAKGLSELSEIHLGSVSFSERDSRRPFF